LIEQLALIKQIHLFVISQAFHHQLIRQSEIFLYQILLQNHHRDQIKSWLFLQ